MDSAEARRFYGYSTTGTEEAQLAGFLADPLAEPHPLSAIAIVFGTGWHLRRRWPSRRRVAVLAAANCADRHPGRGRHRRDLAPLRRSPSCHGDDRYRVCAPQSYLA
jgi:hypothetical protein